MQQKHQKQQERHIGHPLDVRADLQGFHVEIGGPSPYIQVSRVRNGSTRTCEPSPRYDFRGYKLSISCGSVQVKRSISLTFLRFPRSVEWEKGRFHVRIACHTAPICLSRAHINQHSMSLIKTCSPLIDGVVIYDRGSRFSWFRAHSIYVCFLV